MQRLGHEQQISQRRSARHHPQVPEGVLISVILRQSLAEVPAHGPPDGHRGRGQAEGEAEPSRPGRDVGRDEDVHRPEDSGPHPVQDLGGEDDHLEGHGRLPPVHHLGVLDPREDVEDEASHGDRGQPHEEEGLAPPDPGVVAADLRGAHHEDLGDDDAQPGHEDAHAPLPDGEGLHDQGEDGAVGQMEEEDEAREDEEGGVLQEAQGSHGAVDVLSPRGQVEAGSPDGREGLLVRPSPRPGRFTRLAALGGAVVLGQGVVARGLLVPPARARQAAGGVVVDVLGIDLRQEEQHPRAGHGRHQEQDPDVGKAKERDQAPRQDDDRRPEVIAHLVVGHLAGHAVGSHDALGDGVQSGRDQSGRGALDELHGDHPPEVRPVFARRRGRDQREARRGDGREGQPEHFVIGVIHDVSRGRLEQELAHPEDEEQDPRLLLAVRLRHDEEGALHVDHRQSVAEFAEEEGDEAQEGSGRGLGDGRGRGGGGGGGGFGRHGVARFRFVSFRFVRRFESVVGRTCFVLRLRTPLEEVGARARGARSETRSRFPGPACA
ncbi:hypothetical protein ACHAWF_016396 [Thalassiosira exigua]